MLLDNLLELMLRGRGFHVPFFLSKVLDTLIFVRKELSLLVLTDQQADEMLSRLTSYCKEYSLSVTDVELRKCIQHLDLVLETNKTTNLTRILNVEDAAVSSTHLFCSPISTRLLRELCSIWEQVRASLVFH